MTAAALLFSIVVSTPQWVVPGRGLPVEVSVQPSNNNVAIARHDGRLYLAWRSAPTHFASSETRLYVVSSADEGKVWRFEDKIELRADVREPHLLSLGGSLYLYFVEFGKSAYRFEPGRVWRSERAKDGGWGAPVRVPLDGEVPWDIQVRDGKAWMSSYAGAHYDLLHKGEIRVKLRESKDGLDWEPKGGDAVVHRGGASEAAFAFDKEGRLWAMTRNEDGDDSGWGSALATAAPGEPRRWLFPAESDPERYDSPKLFEHEGEIYMVARRDVGGPFDRRWRRLPFVVQRLAYMLGYWSRPKRTALYRIDRPQRKVVWLQDLPSAGDTAFPSIVSTGPHSFLMANYSSPLDMQDASWLHGQISGRGTGIYLLRLDFEPLPASSAGR